MDENIRPALNFQTDMPDEMSAAEFQQRLYGWFEDRGLLSEVRAHLRKQMIGALKDTAIGRTITGHQKHSISPKLQALNLLIAEFLLHQDYHYSLSVFSTEVPLISVLPEFQGLAVNHHLGKEDVSKKWQFSEKDMWDIMETLGVMQHSDEGQTIYNAYYNSNINGKDPLLTCIVRMLHTIQNRVRANLSQIKSDTVIASTSNQLVVDRSNGQQEWMKKITDILSSNNINVLNINEIINIIVNIIDAEKKRLEQDSKEEYLKLQMKLQAQASKKEEEQRKKWLLVNNSLEFEKSKLESEKTKQQVDADNFKSKLQKQQSMLRERSQRLYAREQDLHERECELQDREKDLKKQQLRLQSQFSKLFKEQAHVSDMHTKLQHEYLQKQSAAKYDANFLKALQEECANMKSEITDTQRSVLINVSTENIETSEYDAEHALIKNIMKQLQTENASLKNVNSQQQLRIDELSQRAATLMQDLENTQATVNVLSSTRHWMHSAIVSAPPLVAPPTLTLTHHRNGVNSYSSGGGEDGSRFVPPPPSREYRNYPSPRDLNRRIPPRRLTVHSSSGSDDATTTNDILQEARERLRRLEEESDEVDKHYRQFRLRRAEEGRHSTVNKYLDHSPFGHAPWLNSLNREYDTLTRDHEEPRSSSPSYSNTHQRDIFLEALEHFTAIPGPSRHVSDGNSPMFSNEVESRFGQNLTYEVSKQDRSNPSSLCKYLKQANNFISQTVMRDSHPTSAQNYLTDEPGPSNINLQPYENSRAEDNVERDVEGNDEKKPVDLSFDSSGVDDLLAAEASGVSFSNVETSDKSDTQAESPKND